MYPSSTLVDMNPYEVRFGNKPSVSHLKLFGCDEFLHVPKEKRSNMDKKVVKCIFIGYKEGMKGYKLWDPASRKIVYNRNVVFREVGSKPEPEVIVQIKNNPKKVRFELRNEEDDSYESIESKGGVENLTSNVRRSKEVRKTVERYSPPNFHSTFLLTATDDEPKSVKEVVDLVEGKQWKDVMVKEMESLHNNDTWDLVKLPSGRNPIGSK
jgi:hypothetical protein